jgi:hypothetical protein
MSIRQTRAFLESITNRDTLKQQGYVPIRKFGKDHWSLLGYIGTVVVNRQGHMEGDRIRVNEARHIGIERPRAIREWDPAWGTRLNGYFQNRNDKTLHIPEHDDIDCAEDMQAEGLITMGTLVSCFVQLTDKGRSFVEALNRFKEDGGNFADFPNSTLCKSLFSRYEYEENCK